MKASRSARWRALATIPIIIGLLLPTTPALAAPSVEAAVPAAAPTVDTVQAALDAGQLPDPLDRGPFAPATIQETKLGLVELQEPNASGGAPTTGTSAAPETMEIRGALYYPGDRSQPSPVVVLVHGNHGSCDVSGNTQVLLCTQFKRNEAGYAYLGENLASWGYTVFSVSQDQLMMRQDGTSGRGMHQRRLMIAATLDALTAANAPGGLPVDDHTTIGSTLAGKLDMTRIGLMGHSRGGDAVTSFIDYNRIRTDGPRYPLRGVIALAPVDYERKAPYGTPFMSILPWCDGDVSNLQGARFFERSQYVNGGNPFPSIQVSHLGANHNWYNTVWFADGQDGNSNRDPACGDTRPGNSNNVAPTNHRLSGAASYDPWSYVIDNSDTYNPLVNTKISGDPARMGAQEKLGLATMSAFFRRYVGGEGAFEPYMTGELTTTDSHAQVPASACPAITEGDRAIDCADRVSTSYFAPSNERVDLIRPEVENPLTLNAVGGALSGTGFANPYPDNGGVTPRPEPATGYDWCNPEPDQFTPSYLGMTGRPTGAKACPLPNPDEVGGQGSTRENSPINHSYGRQLALAWEAGQQATLTAQIPAASSDMSGLKALALNADVNFFDPRNPGYTVRTGDQTPVPDVLFNPAASTQDFKIVLTDREGNEASVNAGDPRWGNALHMSTGNRTPATHIVLEQIRVPLTEFAAQGVDITALAKLDLRFGTEGTPASGSIQLADVRFQEAAADAPLILSDGTAVGQGAGFGLPASGPNPVAFLEQTDVTPGELSLPDTVANPASNTTWVVDNDRIECPNANFTSIQQAVDYASPWDTIVICDGVYQERSTPINSARVPVATGAMNGLTINKPLLIKGTGADKVTIMPDQSIADLAGTTPFLRDGGGNVVTVSRQSLGSTDTNEMFVDISGVTITSGSTWAEAGIAYLNTAGRISESVIGPLRTATTSEEAAAHPHGWGVVKTNHLQGAGNGTVESELTVANSVVTGYQAGGILFDGARGADDSESILTRAGIKHHGYVTDTIVTGSASTLFPQVGVRYSAGADGFVGSSRITANTFAAAPTSAVGVELRDSGVVEVRESVITGNGVAVANREITGTAPRTDQPVTVRASLVDGLSQDGSTITVLDPAAAEPAGVPSAVGAIADAAPTAQVVEPGEGTEVESGTTLAPIVRAKDDFAVRSVTLLANGEEVGTSGTSPYTFSWTATDAQKGTSVALTAVVVDAAGQATTSAPVTVRVAADPEPEPEEPGTEEPGTEEPVLTLSTDVVQAGQSLTVSGIRFEATTALRLELHSTPVVLREAVTDGAGSFSTEVTIPASTTAGAHTIRVFDGAVEVAQAAITVTAVPGAPLAVTGGVLWTTGIVIGALLLIVGAAIVILRRRMRQAHTL